MSRPITPDDRVPATTIVLLVLALLWIGLWLAFGWITILALDGCTDSACSTRVTRRWWFLICAQLGNGVLMILGRNQRAVLVICGFVVPPLLYAIIAPV